MKYPIVEIFYSIQGEGAHVGVPATFIRLTGCNLCCSFCDTPNRDKALMGDLDVDSIMDIIKKNPSTLVVITGGEPTIHNLRPLVGALLAENFVVVIETNGTQKEGFITNTSVHYSVCPKPGYPPTPQAIQHAGSIKLLCNMETTEEDILQWMDTLMLISDGTIPEFFLQPIVDNGEFFSYLSNPSVAHTVKLALATGARLSIQTHKILGVA